MRLKPGTFPQYKRYHENVWPELVAEIERSGIARMVIFRGEGDRMFVFSEITNAEAWDKLWASEIHKKWAAVMEPMLELRPDGIIDAGELSEVYHLETKA